LLQPQRRSAANRFRLCGGAYTGAPRHR
jgi:hypothetical protein